MPAARLLIAMHLFALVVSFAAALANAGRFKVIDHDKIVALTQDASDAELKWQPYLKTDGHSCVPFPAVDVDGAVSGGLFPGGPVDGDCESNTGQAYVRWKPVASTDHGETIAYMYAWYLPKDQAFDYTHFPVGHRHGFRHLIVLANTTFASAAGAAGVTESQFWKTCFYDSGEYTCHTAAALKDGTHPLALLTGIKSFWMYELPELEPTTEAGALQPLISWDRMPLAVQEAFNFYDFGAGTARVPFNDPSFWQLAHRAYTGNDADKPDKRTAEEAGFVDYGASWY